MATIDDVYAKLLELETTLAEIKTVQTNQATEMAKLKEGQKELDSNLTKKIALMGTEVSRLRIITR